MSHTGSPSRWWSGLLRGRPTRDLPRPYKAPPLTARRVARDFARWETELAAMPAAAPVVPERAATVEPATFTTVVGTQLVEVAIGHRPIQEVLLHLRRLRAVMDTMTADVSFVRFEGILRAYDDYLFAACHVLEVPTDLVTIGFGRHRDEERARVERLLGEAGLPVR